MKKFRFKDGYECVATTKEEAISQHKALASKKDDLEVILEDLGFKKCAWYYRKTLAKYKFEMSAGKYTRSLVLGVSIESDNFSRVFVYRTDSNGGDDLLSTFIKNDKDFKKNIQKFITKATKVADCFEKWCEK